MSGFLDTLSVDNVLYDIKDKNAYRKPLSGIPKSDLTLTLQDAIDSFITKYVNDLVNYYKTSETYTKAEVQALIGAINQFHFEIYPTLSAVTSPASNVLYLIGPTGTGTDRYEEYVYTTTWVKIGDTSIDLSNYVTITMLNTALADYYTKIQIDALIEDTPDFVEESPSEDMIDEFDRLLQVLYQALADAGVQINAAQQAAAAANAKALLAQQAATDANNAASNATAKAIAANDAANLAAQKATIAAEAATNANNKASLANNAAATANANAQAAEQAATNANTKAGLANDAATLANTKAGYAQEKGDYAKNQGDYAKAKADEIEDAKGNYNSLSARFTADETAIGDVTSEVNTARGTYENLDARLDHIEEIEGDVEFVEEAAGTFSF